MKNSSDNSYGLFAYFYDQLMSISGISYEDVFDKYTSLVSGFNPEKTIIADIACGTGIISTNLYVYGFKSVYASDASSEMVAFFEQGKENYIEENKSQNLDNVIVSVEDMRDFSTSEKVDVVICTLDGINHLETYQDLNKTFASVNANMNSNGAFVFDVNTINKHKNTLSDNAFVYENANIYAVWQNSTEEVISETESTPYCVRTHITLNIFPLIDMDKMLSNDEELDDDERVYARIDDEFNETAFHLDDIKKSLENNGFCDVHIYDFDDISKLGTEFSQKVIFYAVKK